MTRVREGCLRTGHSWRCRECRYESSTDPRLLHLPTRLRKRLSTKVSNAIHRCTRRGHRKYATYGGRGIRVNPVWLRDPVYFILYLASLPGCDDESLYLDREDNDGHYTPGNLRFITPSESMRNRRTTCRNFNPTTPSP